MKRVNDMLFSEALDKYLKAKELYDADREGVGSGVFQYSSYDICQKYHKAEDVLNQFFSYYF